MVESVNEEDLTNAEKLKRRSVNNKIALIKKDYESVMNATKEVYTEENLLFIEQTISYLLYSKKELERKISVYKGEVLPLTQFKSFFNNWVLEKDAMKI